MKFKTINSEKQGTPYSDAVELGDLIQFSGMLGADENGIVEGGLEAEVDQIFVNLKSVSYTHLRAHETREDRGCRLMV